MAGPLFLETDDFQLTQIEDNGERKVIMNTQIPGLSLLLFYSPVCVHSSKIFPIFKKLPSMINGCQFGLINISMNRDLIKMSNSSITPIQYVPFIILYLHGQPYMIYDGPRTENDIREFVISVANKMPRKDRSKFSNEEVQSNSKRQIPEWSLGMPLFGKNDVTYLKDEDAYNS